MLSSSLTSRQNPALFCSASYNASISPTNNGFIELSRRIDTRQT